MKKFLMLFLTSAIMILAAVYIIDKNETNLASNTIDESINYSVFELPNNMQSIYNLSNSDIDIVCATSRGLVSKNKNNEIIPELASEFKVSSDKIQYEFKIKDDIYWSDGSKITSEDVREFLRQLIREENEELIGPLLNVYNAKVYREDKIEGFKQVAITASDDNTLVVRFNSPCEGFLEELTKPQYRLRKDIILWNNLKKNYKIVPYSGDYKIAEVTKQNIVLEKNSEDCKFDRINLLKESSSENAMASYEINLTDIVINPPSSVLSRLSNDKKLITMPGDEGAYIYLNDNTGVSQDGRKDIYKNVCKAIEEYHNNNTSDFELSETCYFREDKKDLIKMQDRKVQINKESEWSKPEVLTIIGEDIPLNRTICKVIKDYFNKNMNITIKYRLVNNDEFRNKELKQKYDMTLINNKTNYKNKEEFYSSLEEYFTEQNLNILERARINDYYGQYTELESSLFNNYNVLPLCFNNKNIAFSNKIDNLEIDSYGNINFDNLN